MLLSGTKKKVKIRAQVYKQDENFTASSQKGKGGEDERNLSQRKTARRFKTANGSTLMQCFKKSSKIVLYFKQCQVSK